MMDLINLVYNFSNENIIRRQQINKNLKKKKFFTVGGGESVFHSNEISSSSIPLFASQVSHKKVHKFTHIRRSIHHGNLIINNILSLYIRQRKAI